MNSPKRTDNMLRVYEREISSTPWKVTSTETSAPQGTSRKPPLSPRVKNS